MTSPHSALRRVFSGSFWRVAAFACEASVGLLLFPFILAALGDEMFGLWGLLTAFTAYSAILDFGFLDAVSREFSYSVGRNDIGRSNRVLSTSLIFYLVLAAIVILIGIAIASFSSHFSKPPVTPALLSALVLVASASLAFELPFRSLSGLLNAKLRFDIIAKLQLIGLFLRTSLIISFLNLNYGILGLAWATLLGKIPGRFLNLYYSKKELPGLRISLSSADRKTSRSLFSFGAFSFISRVADLLRFQTDVVVVSLFVGLAGVAHYRVVGGLIWYFVGLMGEAIGVIFPVFCRHVGEQNSQAFKVSFFVTTRVSVCLSCFVAFGFVIWGSAFIEAWVGASYLDAYSCLVLLSVAIALEKWQHPLQMAMFAKGHQRLVALLSASDGLLNLAFSLIFAHYYGMIGVALGTLAATCSIRVIAQPILGCRALRIPLGSYLACLARTCRSVSFSLVLPTIATLHFAPSGFLGLFAVAGGCAVLYAVTLWFLEFSRAERQALRASLVPKIAAAQ